MSNNYEIYTRFNKATDTKGESVTAIAVDQFDLSKRQMTMPYNYALSMQDNHDAVANALDAKLTEENIIDDCKRDPRLNISIERRTCARYHVVAFDDTKSGAGFRYHTTFKG